MFQPSIGIFASLLRSGKNNTRRFVCAKNCLFVSLLQPPSGVGTGTAFGYSGTRGKKILGSAEEFSPLRLIDGD